MKKNVKNGKKTPIKSAIEDIKLGEKTRVLWEVLMETIGASYEWNQRQCFERMAEIMKNQEAAQKLLDKTIRDQEKVDVSVSD